MLEKIFEFILSEVVIRTVIILILLFILYIVLKNIIDKVLNVRHKTVHVDIRKVNTLKSLFTNILKYVLLFIGIVVILNAFGLKTTTLLAGLGVVGVVVGLALQDILKDLFSGIFIIIENQFSVGDTIEIDNFKGEVIDLGLKTTRIKKYTGEIMMVSNRNIDYVINYSKEDTLEMIDISVDYNEDLERVQQILEELCTNLSNKFKDIKELSVLGVENLSDSYVVFRLSLITKPMQQFSVKREILKAVKNEFDKNKIKIPFPQLEVHNGAKL